jgi:hypothetical protein
LKKGFTFILAALLITKLCGVLTVTWPLMREEPLKMEENHEDSQTEKAVATLEREISANLLGLCNQKGAYAVIITFFKA